MGVGRGASSYLSFDWWVAIRAELTGAEMINDMRPRYRFLVAFFFFVNLLALAVLAKDTRTGSVVKYRIPCSVYAAIAAVFATIRINDLAFATGVMSSSAKALLASYFIQVVPYYIIPFLNGTSFLDTVASRPADVPPMAAEQGYPAAAAHGYPVAHKPEVVGARVPVV
ncbi:hypothetical protein DFJ74DRAFT_291145 [Hyaloraphidium curvatum]|nr:hypothetical protein DFJ74DRAFT_291145 [Hyaloraphidium curvatum]